MVDQLAFSPDGAHIAVSMVDSAVSFVEPDRPPDDSLARVLILAAADGRVLQSLGFGECEAVGGLAWSHDLGWLAVASGPTLGSGSCSREGSEDGIWVEVFDTSTWQPVALLDAETDNPDGVSVVPVFDQVGRLHIVGPFASPSLYDASTLALIGTRDAAHGAMDVHPDGSIYAIFTNSGTGEFGYLLKDSASGQTVDRLGTGAFPNIPYSVAFTPDGRYLVAGTDGRLTSVWDLIDGQLAVELRAEPTYRSAFDPGTERLYTSHADGSVRVWGLGRPLFGIGIADDLGSTPWVNANEFTFGGGFGALNAGNPGVSNDILIFQPDSGEFITRIPNAGPPEMLPSGEVVYSPVNDARGLVAHDPATGSERLVFGCTSPDEPESCAPAGGVWGEFRGAQMSIAGDELAVIDVIGGTYQFVDATTFAPGPTMSDLFDTSFVLTVAFTADWIVAASGDLLSAFDRSTSEERWSINNIEVVNFEVSPSLDLAAVVDRSGSVRLVHLETGDEALLAGTFGRVRGMAFSPDGDEIALGNETELVIVDVRTDRIVQSIPIGGVSDAHWLSEEELLIATKDDLWARLDLNVDGLVARARDVLRRGLSDQECLTYRIDPCPSLEELRRG